MSDVTAPLFTWRSGITLSSLPPTTRHVLLTISLYMNEKGESAFPSQAKLAVDTGLSARSVGEHIRRATSEGFLEVVKSIGQGQAWAQSYYEPCLPAAVIERMEDLTKQRKASRISKMKQLAESRKGAAAASSPSAVKGQEGGSEPVHKPRNLTTEGEEPKRIKDRKEVPTNTSVNTSINKRRERSQVQLEYVALADKYSDPFPLAGDITLGMAESLAESLPGYPAKVLKSQLAVIGNADAPIGLFVEWLACCGASPAVMGQHLAKLGAVASADAVPMTAVLLHSLEIYRGTDMPNKRRVLCFPPGVTPIADSKPSAASKRFARSAPRREEVA